jgi:hypothetical protein
MSHDKSIIHYIGAAILLSVLGAIVLSGLGKTGPDWMGRISDVGIGALAGIAVGGGGVAVALKPKEPRDPTPQAKDEEEPVQ